MDSNEMKCIYCKGVHSHLIENDSYICEYCGGVNYITTSDIEFKLHLASNCLAIYDFATADDIYKEIIDETSDSKAKAMALFGRLLASFGIVYIRGYGSKDTTPTFAQYNPDVASLKNSRYYKLILNLDIDDEQKQKYKDKIEKLDKIYTRISKDLEETPEYDVFICTKISTKTKDEPNNVGYTEDSMLATDLYYNFREKGLKVFYSDKVLKGVDYDSQIYSALSKSKTILVIASSKEYLESVWVESEWRRWLNFIDLDYRTKDTFMLCLLDKKIEIPTQLKKVQKIEQYKLFDYIDDVVNKDKKIKFKEDELKSELEKLREENRLRDEELKKLRDKSNLKLNHIHQYETKIISPTCIDDGYTLHTCIECGEVFKDTIVKTEGHKYEVKIFPPTCTLEGYTLKICRECGHTIKEDFVPMVKHEFKSFVVPATCLEEGTIEEKCIHCGFSLGEKKTPLVEHNKKVIEVVPSTCTHGGYTKYKCEYCNEEFTEKITPILPHDLVLDFIDNKTVRSICKHCGEEISINDIGTMKFVEIFKYIENEDSTYTITEVDFEKAKELQIDTSVLITPVQYEGKQITKIGERAFAEMENLERIYVTSNIIEIEKGAFFGCRNLKYLMLNEELKIIGDQAFYSCQSLETLDLPNGLEKIGSAAFGSCDKLLIANIPMSVREIGSFAFAGCSSLLDAYIHIETKEIGEYAFQFCYGCDVVVLSDYRVKKLPETWDKLAFSDVNRIKKVLRM